MCNLMGGGVHVQAEGIPSGLPTFSGPVLRSSDVRVMRTAGVVVIWSPV